VSFAGETPAEEQPERLAMLAKIEIRNYRVFQRFSLAFRDGLNVVVGDNDSGKTTLLEAVSVALTGRLADKQLQYALSPHLFNQTAAAAYIAGLENGERPAPPEITIDLFLDGGDEYALLRGTNNLLNEDAPGLRVRACFDERFAEEYETFVSGDDPVRLVPAEYYRVEWLGFSGNPVTRRAIPISASRIDASAIRLQSGADYYLQQIIQDHLDPAERAELSRAYRSLREKFSGTPAIEGINAKLALTKDDLTDRDLSLSIDISQRTAWESSLIPHLDELPFQFVGTGAQNMLKVLLALNRTADDATVILVEEPENHLSPASLNGLVRKICDRCAGKQLLVTTHSSYVLNKLGLDQLVLLHDQTTTRLDALPGDTPEYFKKLPGYDTLRLVLAKRVILVEGPSDELIVQRAFKAIHGMLPMEAGVDVITIRGLSFKRFLDIALPLSKTVAVVTDNDGRALAEVLDRYRDYLVEGGSISIHVGDPAAGHTLEPQLVHANGREFLNDVFGTTFDTDDDLIQYMTADKTATALALFETERDVAMPAYVADAISA
jgi:predicted ATPase